MATNTDALNSLGSKPTLPKVWTDKFESNTHPSLIVIEGKQKASTGFDNTSKPEVPFKGCFFLVDHDPRLTLAQDTYVQLTMAAGLKVKIKQKGIQTAVDNWMHTIKLERKIEDGLYSYYGCGNMMFEVAPKRTDLEEFDMATITQVKREKGTGEIEAYIQQPDSMTDPVPFTPDEVIHFKLTSAHKEVWARGLFHSLFAPRTLDADELPIIMQQWRIEDDMVKIFDSYASPIMMINFKDAGEQWIKKQETEFKKMKAGAKIITDKEFEAKVFEVNGASKFDKYVDHRQSNLIETGAQFPLGFFNAEFGSTKAAEITDSLLGRKIKRIQKRLAAQIRDEIIIPYIKDTLHKPITLEEITVQFEIESKSEIGEAELNELFKIGVVKRSEYRKHLAKKSTIELDESDIEDTPPITSVTPTNDMRTTQPTPASQGKDPITQQGEIAAMQAQMKEMKEIIESKVPNPRGRPKKD